MRVCAVLTCNNKGVHTYPADPKLKQLWIKATRVDVQRKIGWNLRKYSCICSEHFKPSDFETRGKFKYLIKTAVPSVFPWAPRSPTPDKIIPDTEDIIAEKPLPFNPDKAIKKYSKTVPISFVEEYPCFDSEITLKNNDPLDDKNIEQVLVNPSPGLLEFSVEAIDVKPVINPISEDLNRISTCDNSVQTDLLPVKIEPNHCPFSVYNYRHSDKAINFFTGFETFPKLQYVFSTLGDCKTLKYSYKSPPNQIDTFDQFFITLLILHMHKEFKEIGFMYLISVKQVRNIFETWIRFMVLHWQKLDWWIDKNTATYNMPSDFYDGAKTRDVIDSECPIKKPGLSTSPMAQQIIFCSYKSKNTIQFLIGISPSGLISYISPRNGDSATFESSNLNRFTYDDDMPYQEKGNMPNSFTKGKVNTKGNKVNSKGNKTNPKGNKINPGGNSIIPEGNKINAEFLETDGKVASNKVHADRIIDKLKSFKILRQRLNPTETMLSSEISFICAALVNFQSTNIGK